MKGLAQGKGRGWTWGFLWFLAALSVHAVQPKVVCESPSYDFGQLPSTNTIQHAFLVWNKGDADLAITKTRACCGAAARLGTNSIAPGSNTTYSITLPLAARSGSLNKSLYLHTNDPENMIVQLKIVGTVVPIPGQQQTDSHPSLSSPQIAPPPPPPRLFSVDPSGFHLGRISECSGTSTVVTVTAETKKNIRVLDAFAKGSGLKASVTEIERGREYDVNLTLVPPLSLGPMRESVSVVVKDYGIQRLELPVFADVIPDLYVTPTECALNTDPTDPAHVRASFSVLSRSGGDFGITVQTPDEQLTVQTNKSDKGSGWIVEISGKGDGKEWAGKNIRIHADILNGRELTIPIRMSAKNSMPVPPPKRRLTAP